MGLDMYLSKRLFVGALFIEGSIDITKNGKKLPINLSKVTYIEESVMYWRKVSAIHRWFVENVQNGKDDCGTYVFKPEKIKQLLQLVKRVLNNRELAPDLLPTMNGFFFGSQEYDDWCFEDLAQTKEVLELIVKDPATKEFDYEFIYQSSWT